MDSLEHQRNLAARLSLPMFLLTLFFLALLAGLIVTLVDIPRMAELAVVESDDGVSTAPVAERAIALVDRSGDIGAMLLKVLLLIWPLFWMEFAMNLWHSLQRSGWKAAFASQRHGFLCCVFPPLRLGLISSAWGDRLWLPILSWQHPGKSLSQRLEQAGGKPMLVVAFLILPILLLEFGFKGLVDQHTWLRITLHVCTGFIWWCFAAEFVIRISATNKKIKYIKRNWIDLVIILLPVISFLRTVRVLRLARLAKVQQLSKMTRIYRLKGLGAKAMRGLVLMQFVNKVLRIKPEKTLAKLREKYNEKSEELAEMGARIQELEQQMAHQSVESETVKSVDNDS